MNKQIFKFKFFVVGMDKLKPYLSEVKDNLDAIVTILYNVKFLIINEIKYPKINFINSATYFYDKINTKLTWQVIPSFQKISWFQITTQILI